MHLSWLDPHKMRKMTVVGSEKMVVFDDMELERKVTVYEKGATTTRTQSRPTASGAPALGDIHSPKIANDEPLRIECQHFLDCVRDGARPLSDGRDGLAVVRALEAMEISLREGGRPVKTAELS